MSNILNTFNSTFLGPLSSVLFGLIWGSFSNVCILRLPEDESIVFRRSHCRHCHTTIPWYWNIPLLSYFLLRGRCRYCGHPISLQYPLVELGTALFFLLAYAQFGIGIHFLAYSILIFLLITISLIDFRHKIIPDELSLGGIVLGFLFCLLTHDITWWASILGTALGGGIFYAVAYGYEKLAKREGLGGGDVKLLGMLGAWFGYQSILILIIISTALGSLVGIAMMIFQKKSLRTAIPFGPFLALAALAYLFAREPLLRLFFPTFY